jgi:hypothetical protein
MGKIAGLSQIQHRLADVKKEKEPDWADFGKSIIGMQVNMVPNMAGRKTTSRNSISA